MTSLSLADLALLGGLFALMAWIGYRAGKGERDTADFFLARRQVPTWAAALSFLATEISAVTIISVPATAYRENWNYAQFFIGSAVARLGIAYFFIPAFYKFQCTTIYEFLKYRFGAQSQYAATCFFFVTRLLASGVRLMAACLAVSVFLGWPIAPVIAVFSVFGMIYIGYGGIRAVVWTNVLQALTFIGAGLATLVFLASSLGTDFLAPAWAAGKLTVFNWGPSPAEPGYLGKFFSDPNILVVATLNGLFGSLAAFGTDHEMMQKLLTVETREKSQRTMLVSTGLSFAVLMLFLAVGAGLFSYYQAHPEAVLPQKLDAIYPHFASTVMPGLLRGLVLAAIIMASIDSPLASLTAVFVTDIFKPLLRPGQREAYYLKISRVSVVVFGILLGLIAYAFSFFQNILWLAFKIGGVTFGSLLGVFLLGLLTKRQSNRANVAAMIAMAGANAVLLYLSEAKVLPIGWSWLVILGTLGTFGLSWLLGPRLDRGASAPGLIEKPV